ncbi:PP2C family protein-serine/threonine phosphatase [Marinicrinis lubricantis]|uniref:Serine/threonine protein phosphatase n=1 Tax=Marinicrinis lubricantis TaxID=2086470 RepID=A0ABW1INE7_9BACL
MRKDNSDLKTSFLSEEGTFLENKDFFAYAELDDMACWVLADGLDNGQYTESARLAVESVLAQFTERPTMSRRRLRSYLHKAHKHLHSESTRVRLKASLVLVVTDYSHMIWAVAGNSRMYHLNKERVLHQSKDQSLAQRMAEYGQIRQEDVDRHEERTNLLHYLGQPETFEPYVSKKVKLEDDDVIVLCSYGLWEGVNAMEMLDAREEADGPEDLLDTLEEVLLSKQRSIVNNYTAAVVYVNKTYKEAPKKRNYTKIVRRVAMILIPALLFGGGAYYYKARSVKVKAETITTMTEHERNGDKEAAEGDFDEALNEYSLARNASNRLNNKIQTKLIGEKMEVAQLVTKGNQFFKDGDYEKAVESYDKALKEASNYESFDMSEVEASKKEAESYLVILGIVEQGDVKFKAGDFAGAQALYQKANEQAMMASFTEGQQQVQVKMDAVKEKTAEIELSKQLAEGENTEKQGDKQMAAKDYAKAIATYTVAQNIYQKAGQTDKVLAVQYKIIEAQEKLNPPEEEKPEDAAQGSGQGTAQGTGQSGGTQQTGGAAKPAN